jgi:nucleoside-diphosphate-sugar epimerase
MRILVVGGTGMIGGHAALHLARAGHDVVLAARRPPAAGTALAGLPLIRGDYAAGDFAAGRLAGFEAVVFAAGQDIRHAAPAEQTADFWQRMQSEGVPALAEAARRAGVGAFVQIGSYYHQLRPDLAAANPYVRARQLADEGARALARPGFRAITLNPPSIVGAIPGVPARRYATLAAWGRGERPDIPVTAPPGGTVYMSVRSLTEAIAGAVSRGEGGRAYLVGDESLSFRDYFQLFFDVAGNPAQVQVVDAPHPVLPDAFIVQGRGNTLAYEPDPAETALLGYRRGDVRRAVAEVVALAEG